MSDYFYIFIIVFIFFILHILTSIENKKEEEKEIILHNPNCKLVKVDMPNKKSYYSCNGVEYIIGSLP